jgi:competence protein ComGC
VKRDDGFVLIEALIAILILSIALVTSLGGLAAAVRVAGRGEEMTKTVLEKEKKLFETEIEFEQCYECL